METLEDYYRNTDKSHLIELFNGVNHNAHFNIFSRYNCYCSLQYNRIDYYKIMLVKGKGKLLTSRGEVNVDEPALIFLDNSVKFGWETLMNQEQDGYSCLFNEYFTHTNLKVNFQALMSKFSSNQPPILILSPTQYDQFYSLFREMEVEYRENSIYKDQLLKTVLELILIKSIKIHEQQGETDNARSNSEILKRFIALLENQFPIDNPTEAHLIRKPNEYANLLNIHVNYLNYLVKKTLGKTTSNVIQERILVEAMSLLRYSSWQISEIAFALGFSYPQHFTKLFKTHFNETPFAYRERFLNQIQDGGKVA